MAYTFTAIQKIVKKSVRNLVFPDFLCGSKKTEANSCFRLGLKLLCFMGLYSLFRSKTQGAGSEAAQKHIT